MPEICRFLGIRITMYVEDHPPPHLHAEYGEHEAMLGISDGGLIEGYLPLKQ